MTLPIVFRYVDHTLVRGDEVILSLSPTEAAVLGILSKAKGRVVDWDHIIRELYLHENDVKDARANIGQYIHRLRALLEPFGHKIENVFAHGFRIHPVIETDWSNPL